MRVRDRHTHIETYSCEKKAIERHTHRGRREKSVREREREKGRLEKV